MRAGTRRIRGNHQIRVRLGLVELEVQPLAREKALLILSRDGFRTLIVGHFARPLQRPFERRIEGDIQPDLQVEQLAILLLKQKDTLYNNHRGRMNDKAAALRGIVLPIQGVHAGVNPPVLFQRHDQRPEESSEIETVAIIAQRLIGFLVAFLTGTAEVVDGQDVNGRMLRQQGRKLLRQARGVSGFPRAIDPGNAGDNHPIRPGRRGDPLQCGQNSRFLGHVFIIALDGFAGLCYKTSMQLNSQQGLSRRERQIMDILYQRGKSSAAEVREAMTDAPSYSAVRAMLRVLEEKGHVRHQAEELRYVYIPTVPRDKAKKSAVKHILDTFFDDSPEQIVAALLDVSSTRLTNEELDRMARMIEKAKTEGK